MKRFSMAVLLLATFWAACKKTDTKVPDCVRITPSPGLHKSNGSFVHPILGTFYYQDVQRNYQATAPNVLQYRFSYRNAAGGLDSTNLYVDVVFSTVDSSVTVRPSTAVVTPSFDVQTPNPNWYDSCTGTLYLKFSWSGASRKITDTCHFN
jgi:hypothetical protein